MTGYAQQASYQVRLEWGLSGLAAIAQDDPTVIVVDVLSFSTAVSVALSRGASVMPYPYTDERALAYALRHGALLAGSRGTSEYSLSPRSLLRIASGSRIVLPSPNGSAICFRSSASRLLTGCLRNRMSVVELAQSFQRPIAVIAAGERWPDGSLRPSLEDLLGAGAIISALSGERSPEAQAAALTFESNEDVAGTLLKCASGVELSERGFTDDVLVAAQLDVDGRAALLEGGVFDSERPG
jgi:2-phosphosulfolactate phosphatase